jgi:hypothetical protein
MREEVIGILVIVSSVYAYFPGSGIQCDFC